MVVSPKASENILYNFLGLLLISGAMLINDEEYFHSCS